MYMADITGMILLGRIRALETERFHKATTWSHLMG